MAKNDNTLQGVEVKLLNAGFLPIDTSDKRGLIVSIEGDPNVGKTHFGFTAPGPIAVFDFDEGTSGVVKKFPNKTIFTRTFRFPIAAKVEAEFDYKRAWDDFVNSYMGAIQSGVRTVFIDTATEMWELVRLAELGRLQEVPPRFYSTVNNYWREVISRARSADIILVLSNRLKDEYVGNAKTGGKVLAGNKDTHYDVDVALSLTRNEKQVPVLEILKSRFNRDVAQGFKFTGSDVCTFPNVASFVCENSVSDWE